MSDSMLANLVAINVKPEVRKAFLDASVFEAQCAVSENSGVYEYHLTVDKTDPNRFYFYEVFRDNAALEEHRKTKAYKDWRLTIESMIEGEIEAIAKMYSIFPTAQGFEAQKPGLLKW